VVTCIYAKSPVTLFAIHTGSQPALGPAHQDKRQRNHTDLGIQSQGKMRHRRKLQDMRCKARLVIWEAGSMQGGMWEEAEA